MRLPASTIRQPYFNIFINGEQLDDAIMQRVTSCAVTNSDEQSDSAQIVISDPTYLAFDSISIVEGAEIEIYGGYVGYYRRLMKGHIAGLDPNFPNNGPAQLTLVCMDETYPMSITQENITWKNAKRSDIARRFAIKYGFKANVVDTKEIVKSISQSNQTDAQFLQTLATAVGFVAYVRDGVLYFGPRNLSGSPSATFSYNSGDSSLMSFRPQFVVVKDVASQQPTVITVEVLPTKKKTTTKVTTKKKAVKHTATKANKTVKKPSRTTHKTTTHKTTIYKKTTTTKKPYRKRIYYKDNNGNLHWKYATN